MNSKSILRAAAFTAVLTLVGAGQAVAQSATFQVSARVGSHCTIEATPLNFTPGSTTYDPTSTTATDAVSTITARCTRGTTATVGLNDGVNGVRRLTTGGTLTLGYNLYKNADRDAVWGDSGVLMASYLAETSAPYALTVYGRLAAGQDVPAGTYLDTVTATIHF